MSKVHTITLEILRPGPAHNQLLSPLTSYLALCDNRGAVTLQLPFEHREMLRQRATLAYQVPRAQRQAQLQQTADAMGQVLGHIPTLNAALAQTPYGQDRLIHLRLVLSAAELALLPFELATAPPGFPGEAKPLLLQSSAPITLTREVRNATVSREHWSRPPRILVAAASPPGYEPVPLRAHLLALRRAIDAWVPTERAGGVRQLLTVLPRASLQQIREACASADFTHVHVLAHGATYQSGLDVKFGLALFSSSGDRADVVGGHRLADALRTHRRDGQGMSSPNVLTLCACDSGNVNDVIAPGASLAHALHESGIPWVVASQFPLSMLGSTIVCEVLYDGLLRGDDPRVTLHHLRQVLRAECSETHDWASVVAYAAVPPDFDDQVHEARVQQSQRAINVAFSRVDELLASPRHRGATETAQQVQHRYEQIDAILARLDEQLLRLRNSLPHGDGPVQRNQQVGILSRQGSVEKRRAYIWFQQEQHGPADPNHSWVEALRRARRCYFRAAKLALNKHWPLTQMLSTYAILGEPLPSDYWTVARIAAELDLDHDRVDKRAWAQASLVELHLLALLFQPEAEPAPALEAAAALWRLAGSDSFAVESTRRQLERYLDWGKPAQDARFVAAVREVLEILSQPS
ncbi:MAG: CHAT domain-containing protein [Myxococcales bacterium]|nr:CHAT domain-containing protein [Myxococcota bacterium]MDW8283523.1 CHAT domain-containing protein [Myxococcales bacterium]